MSEPHFRVVGQIDRGGGKKKEGKNDGALSCYRAGGRRQQDKYQFASSR